MPLPKVQKIVLLGFFDDDKGDSGGGAEEIRSVDVNYQDLINDIAVGDTVLVDNGLIRLEVLEKRDARIRCRVLIPGELKSKRHINLPGVKEIGRAHV